MNLPLPVVNFCRANGYGEIRSSRALGGGCINNASQLDTEAGPLFLKLNPAAPPDMFEREAEGLNALASASLDLSHPPGPPLSPEVGERGVSFRHDTPFPSGKGARGLGPTPHIPLVLSFGQDFILQEFIAPAPRQSNFWETLGAQLAALHSVTSPQFGFEHDNYLGRTPQINTWEEDGHRFFSEHRLRYQANLARRNHRLDSNTHSSLISLVSHISFLIPPQPASLLHGDLWSGNILSGPQGEPVLIDPAAHYGWAEAELAMMTLFGSVPSAFFGAYESVRPLAPGYKERFDLYNLYHLLNHLNLFGESYVGSVRAILRRYG